MMILVQPMWSKRELNSDSNYTLISALVREMARTRPDIQFVLLFPDEKSGFKYDDDGLFALENIVRVPQRVNSRKFGSALSFEAVYYDTLFRRMGFDAVWCNLVECADRIAVSGDRPYHRSARPVVIAHHHYVIHKSLPYPMDTMIPVAWAQIGGALAADVNVFHSHHAHRMFFETAAQFANEDTCTRISGTSRILPLGVVDAELTPVLGRRRNRVPVIIYNHRLQKYKRFRITFSVLEELYREGLEFKVLYTNSSPEKLSKVAGYPFVEARLCPTRREYLAAIREGDLAVTNSEHETFCISAVETMALGMPLVAPDRVTFPEITGKAETGYPYLFRGREQEKEFLRRLLTDPDERRAWGARLADYVAEKFAVGHWAREFADLFERESYIPVEMKQEHLEIVRRAIREDDGASVPDLCGRLMRLGNRRGGLPFGNQVLTPTKMVRVAAALGCAVRVERGEQRVFGAA